MSFSQSISQTRVRHSNPKKDTVSGHFLSNSNSFGFEMEKDAAGCRTLNRNYIVGGYSRNAGSILQNNQRVNAPFFPYSLSSHHTATSVPSLNTNTSLSG